MVNVIVYDDLGNHEEFEAKPDMPLLDQIEEIGMGIASSCRSGTCGICGCTIYEGLEYLVDMDGNPYEIGELEDEDTILTCSSYPKSDSNGKVVIEMLF